MPGPLSNPLADATDEDLAGVIEALRPDDPADELHALVAEAARRLRALDVIRAELDKCDRALTRMPYGAGLLPPRSIFARHRQAGEPPVEEAGRVAAALAALVERLAGVTARQEQAEADLRRYRRMFDTLRDLAAEVLPALAAEVGVGPPAPPTV